VLVSPPIRQTAGPHAKKRSSADYAGAPKFPLKAIHNELPAAAHGENRNASLPAYNICSRRGPTRLLDSGAVQGFFAAAWQEIPVSAAGLNQAINPTS
jgi:hypothetical protein